MQLKNFLYLCLFCISLSACSNIHKECKTAWKKVEKLGQQVGLSKEDLKQRQQEFETNISRMDYEQAKLMCSSRNSFIDLVK